jgi:hypothetical protein
MKPSIYSHKKYEREGIGWHYITEDATISKVHYENNYFYKKHGFEKYITDGKYFTLSFSYTVEHNDDYILFALIKPYSFSRLYEFLYHLELQIKSNATLSEEANGHKSIICYKTQSMTYSRGIICHTSNGLPIDIIKISGILSSEHKKVILIMARVHPSETPGSYQIEQLIRSLVTPNIALKYFTFIIIPMLNPDGVVMGNTRTDGIGNDLNRCWGANSDEYPLISKIKEYIRNIYNENGQISLFCDFHGHSKTPNSFLYCCYRCEDADATWSQARVFPKLLAKHSQYFALNCCQFKIEAEKVVILPEIYQQGGVMERIQYQAQLYIRNIDVRIYYRTKLLRIH